MGSIELLDSILREDRLPDESDGLESIGSGNNRIVFRILDDRYGLEYEGAVVKRAYPYVDENVRETEVWGTVENTEYEECFVPVLDSADDALWVIMPYVQSTGTAPVETLNILQEEFEGTDIKASDFGSYNGSIRCHDYGTCLPIHPDS